MKVNKETLRGSSTSRHIWFTKVVHLTSDNALLCMGREARFVLHNKCYRMTNDDESCWNRSGWLHDDAVEFG
jgi:hypothetical protein